jgi:hypothetical protein
LTDASSIDDPLIRASVLDQWTFNQSLGSLRARVGVSAAIIIDTFNVDVDEVLSQILPPPIDSESNDPS